MHEPSDGIAEEVERQLQLALAAAAIAARRAIAAREQAIEQARRESEQAARAAQARIDAERLLATERLRPVFDDAWWETAGPQEIADMWQEANSWRDPDQARPRRRRSSTTPRTGSARRCAIAAVWTRPKCVALAAVQELEHEHQATLARSSRPASRVRRPPRKSQRRAWRSTTRSAASSSAQRLAGRGRARACDRGANARRSRPSPRGRGGGADPG